jgi:hypothetical protein
MKRYSLAVLLSVSFLLSQCGGGSGGDEGSSSSIVTPLKTSTIRTFVPGDSWSYTGSGTITQGGSTVSITGSGSDQILSSSKVDPVTAVNCLDEYLTLTLTGPGGTVTTRTDTFFTQDGTGSVFVYGTNVGSGDIWITSTPYYYLSSLSPMAVGQSYGGSVTFTDGSTLTVSDIVTGTENVSTGIGTFETYKINQSATYNFTNGDRTVENNTIWYVPGLGMVQLQANTSYHSGGLLQLTLSFTATLTSTNVSY